jgi:hypothetical protein
MPPAPATSAEPAAGKLRGRTHRSIQICQSPRRQGLPEAIPLEMCCLGWQESLEQLARLVEPEIAG